MTLIGSDFQPKPYAYTVRCSECGKKIAASIAVLVSIKDGKVKKRVCGEDCRLTFDDHFWRGVARRNAVQRHE